MPVVDYERAWLDLKRVVASKPSHGKKDLLDEITRIEIECAVPEGQESFDGTPPANRREPAEQSRQHAVSAHG